MLVVTLVVQAALVHVMPVEGAKVAEPGACFEAPVVALVEPDLACAVPDSVA